MRAVGIDSWDAELATLARAAGAQKYGFGVGLEALARIRGHHELGFSSLEAYALECCERSARWVQETRALARRLEQLPAIREALVSGRVSYSMATLLAKMATADDETAWLNAAEGRTVRQVSALVRDPSANTDEMAQEEETETTLSLTVDREDAWALECVGMIVRHAGGETRADVIEALVGEGSAALLPEVRREALTAFDDAGRRDAQRAWEAQLATWRDEAEELCELAHPEWTERESPNVAWRVPRFDGDAGAIDVQLRGIAAEMARKDLELGQLAERFWKEDGWRQLGYASETQYCRERLGCSVSCIKAKRALARRAAAVPELATAIAAGELGYEAARLVATVAARDTVSEWIARARERTVKHLREDVDAAQLVARLGGTTRMVPPRDETMKKVAHIEASVVSGEMFAGNEGGQMSAALADLVSDAHTGKVEDRDGEARSLGRVTLRFRVGASLARYYRTLEDTFLRHGAEREPFIRFLCTSFIESWRHGVAHGKDVEYGHIYARDRFRCTSPVCGRRDVTPHHLRFRAHGGDDSDENLTSLCVFCHLHGVHGGRLRVARRANDMEWTIGASGHTVVRGRERLTRVA